MPRSNNVGTQVKDYGVDVTTIRLALAGVRRFGGKWLPHFNQMCVLRVRNNLEFVIHFETACSNLMVRSLASARCRFQVASFLAR
jgi:hypothetical protein